MITQPSTEGATPLSIPSTITRRSGMKALIIAGLILSGASSPVLGQGSSSGNLDFTGYKIGIAIGAVAIAAVVVAVVVNHNHHFMSGCVLSSSNGLELQTGDSKTVALQGESKGITAGDRIKVHGSKVKKARGATGPDFFKVDQLKKDYGPCHVDHASTVTAPQ
jgi:hypothetical protein